MDDDDIDIKLNIQLFDFASKSFKAELSFKIEDDYFCITNKNELIKKENQSDIGDNFFLFHAYFNESNNIVIDNIFVGNYIYQRQSLIDELDNYLWYIIQSNLKEEKNKKYNLIKGDIIKLGNIKFLVNKIIIENNIESKNDTEKEEEEKEEKEEKNNFGNKNSNEDCNINAEPYITNFIPKIKGCKFCSSYNFSICECPKISHFPCFQNINNEKLKKEKNKNNNIIKYYIKDFYCKKCNCQFSFRYESSPPLESFEFDYPEDNYIILESLGTQDKTVYVIELNDQEIKIGKSDKKDNDLIIKDESIKDEHAVIKFDEKTGNVSIESLCKDEFNLSVLIRDEIELSEGECIFKAGNNIFSINMAKDNDSKTLEEE